MGQKLYILGIGPGDENLITPAAVQILEECDVLIGGKRNLAVFRHLKKEEIIVGNNLEEIRFYLEGHIGTPTGKETGELAESQGEKALDGVTAKAMPAEERREKKIAVLVSGDPGLFSMLDFLKRSLPGQELEVVPGISSLQVLCARLGLTWDDMLIKSVHGREQKDLAGIIRTTPKVALFTGGEQSPDGICRMLVENGLEGVLVSVGENLSYVNERIIRGTAEEIQRMRFDSLSIMIIENAAARPEAHMQIMVRENAGKLDHFSDTAESAERIDTGDKEPARKLWEFETPGIPDDRFIRGEVPMTKEEVRAVSIAKLRLTGNETVYDVGAGTGSVSVECALRCRNGRVYAIEKEEDALELIRRNAEAFGLDNVEPVAGLAPCPEMELPAPDRVFVGGSGGRMEEIVRWIAGGGKPVRVVLNAIALESAVEAIQSLEKEGFENIEVVSLSVAKSRRAGGKHLMQALNPIYIISGEKPGRKHER